MAGEFNGNIRDMAFWRGAVAEFLGTMFVVFIVTSVWVSNPAMGMTGDLALATGFTYAAALYFAKGYSGGHLNPIVSLVAVVFQQIHVIQFAVYFLMQILGGIIGSAFVRAARDGQHQNQWLGAVRVFPNSTDGQAFLWEFMGTLFVLIVFVETSYGKAFRAGNIAPLAQGTAYYAATVATGRWTSASLNPARAFGPALVADRWDDHWLYWIAPIVAAVVVIILGAFVFNVAKPIGMGPKPATAQTDEEEGAPMRVVNPGK
ncbi:plasma membrane intrinsic protein [Thecamonas trahens ATCC 50062]|uniref:Plasma membrane intrinsic protein n=1 Tax=Thecamonas trahens ATCC 50062 TaxID=461836 RepID=A0A0L0DHQ0_THETB|nr:plasma membrane intrinsic protein [Thecamonas trahens ATCC 50062]KNC51750.1 plasma membrane intrinsic protein [Thecamonas trahens ATCC 50062]|eukprot:XP_013755878.1 plasma membrane intrinsic protein [Thecamonas trahens ATCC 50062]